MSDVKRVDKLIAFIDESAEPAHKILIPVSGSDSALVYWLSAQAYPRKALAVHFGNGLLHPEWFRSLGGELRMLSAPDPKLYRTHQDEEVYRWSEAQRIALAESCWLFGSRNRTEEVFGTFSIISRLATVLPINNLWKTDVMRLGAFVGVPKAILDSSRRADPGCDRPKEVEEIGLERIDAFLKIVTGELGVEHLSTFARSDFSYLFRTFDRNQFKRNLPLRGPQV